MNGQPHLFRRGQVFHWRRRISRQSTKIVDIKLSLRTTDPRIAVILARKLSAESDIAMEHAVRNQITETEARSWLAEVAKRERAKIATIAMFSRVDSCDPADDRRHDEAMRAAWEHIANKGVHAPTPDDNSLFARDVDLLRSDLTSDTRRQIILREFKALTGRETVSAQGTIEAMDLYIRGKHLAWDESVSQEPEAPNQLPIETQETREPDHPQNQGASDHEILDPSLPAIVQRMNALKRAEGIEEKTLRQYESFVTLFSTLTGITDVRSIRQSHVTSFRTDLNKLPKSWGKSPRDAGASREEVMARAEQLPAEKLGLSVATVNRHLEHLTQIVTWADDEGIAIDQKLKPSKLRRKEIVRDRDKRQAFTAEQLKTLFRSPVWQGSKSVARQWEPGDRIIRNGLYWCPLIAAYTGARREEIAGLMPKDIIEVEGTLCFDIDDNDLRRVKNLSSQRKVPIHSHLIELGFMDYVDALRTKGSRSLFPELGEASGSYGRKLGRQMREVIDRSLGAEGAGLTLHSCRHYVQNALDNFGVDDKVVRDIIGHEGKDTHEKVYRKATPMHILKDAIERLPKVG